MADGVIFLLLGPLTSTAYEYVDGEVKHVLYAKKDIEKFAGNLKAIPAILKDAEQRQVKEASVRIWLDQLKDISISFEMVDVLDEWNTYIHSEKQEREGVNALVPNNKKKVTLSVPPSCFCFNKIRRVILRRDIALKIKDLNGNGKLSAIDEQRKMYEFQPIFAAMYCILFGIVAAVGIIFIQFAKIIP